MKKLLLFFALVLSLMGVTQAWGETITEDFDNVKRLTKEGDEATSYAMGYSLDNGWVYVGSGAIYTSADYYTDYYGLVSGGYSGNCLSYNYGTTNNAYIVIPTQLVNTIKFKAKRTTSSSSYTKYCKVSFYEATEDNGSYTIGSFIASVAPTSTSWADYSADLGTEGKYVAINLVRAAIDNIEAETYEVATTPKMGVFSDEAAKTKVASGTSVNFGLKAEPQTVTYYLKNTGAGTLEATVTTTGGYEADKTSVSVNAGEVAAVTITQPSGLGASEGTVTFSATDQTDVVVNLSGTIRDASKFFETFEAGTLPENWESTGGWTFKTDEGGYAQQTNYSNYNLTTPIITFDGTEKLQFEAAYYSSASYINLKVQYSEDNETWTDATLSSDEFNSVWTPYTADIPAGNYYIRFVGRYAYLRNVYGGEEAKVAIMKFSPADYDFGLITADATSTEFTIQNTGKAELTGLTITSSDETKFAVNNSATSIPANGSANFTVTMKKGTAGASEATISVSADGFDAKTFKVTGAVLADDALIITFDDNKLPENWTNASWTFANGAATGKSSSAYLTTPKLKFTEGDILVIKAKAADSYGGDYVTVQGSADNGATWAAYSKKIELPKDNSAWSTFVVSDIPTTVNKLRFLGYYVTIDEMGGLTYDENDPKLGVFKEETLTTEVTTGTVWDFGFVTEEQTLTYYITNSGSGTLTIDEVSGGALNAVVAETSLAAAAKTKLTITVPTATKGYIDETITVKTSVGNFTIPVKGVMMDPERFFIDFTSADIPSDWTATDWSKSANGYIAPTGYSTKNMETAVMEAEANEIIVIKAKGSSYSGTLAVNYKAEDAEDWTTLKSSESFGDTNWHIYTVTIPEAGKYQLQIAGYYAQIEKIYGMKEVQEPKLLVKYDNAELATGDKVEFGAVKESVTKTITIENTGAAALEVSSIASDNGAFTVDKTSVNVDAKGNTTFNITFNYDAANIGSKSATITLTNNATEEPFTIAVSAMALAADAWQVDFENGVPEGWYNKGWEITNPSSHYYYTASKGASSSYYDDNILVTPLLETNANDVLSLETRANSNANDYTLTVEYSADRETWNTLTTLTSTSSIERQEIVVPETGKFYLRFSGKNNIIDNLAGLKLAEVSRDLYKTAESLPTEGTTGEAYEASISVKNLWNTEESATAELYIDGDLKTTAEAATVSALGTATLPVSWTPEKAGTYKAKVVVKYGDNQTVESAEQEFTVVLATLTLSEYDSENKVKTGNYKVVLKRNMNAGFNTIVLPFDLTEAEVKAAFGEGTKLFEYSGSDNGMLNVQMKSDASISAGVPYIIYVDELIFNADLTFDNVTIASAEPGTAGDGLFKGTYTYIASPNMEGKYGLIADGHIGVGTKDAYCYAYRGYFDAGSTTGAKITGIAIHEGEATSIVGIEKLNMQNGDIYSLSGRKMNSGANLPAGIYIQNGKKIIVK